MNLIRLMSVIFGVGFIALGIAGFIPIFAPEGYLFGYFEVDAMHNWIHLVSGAIALGAATRLSYAIWYFKVFGVIYLVIALAGFLFGGNLLILHANMADNFLHIFIAVIALYLGFYHKERNAA